MSDDELDRKVDAANAETLLRFASAIVRVMREENLPCDRETAYELMADLWEHSKRSEIGSAVLPPDMSFVEAFDHDTRELFWTLVRRVHAEAS